MRRTSRYRAGAPARASSRARSGAARAAPFGLEPLNAELTVSPARLPSHESPLGVRAQGPLSICGLVLGVADGSTFSLVFLPDVDRAIAPFMRAFQAVRVRIRAR